MFPVLNLIQGSGTTDWNFEAFMNPSAVRRSDQLICIIESCLHFRFDRGRSNVQDQVVILMQNLSLSLTVNESGKPE
jgi:hypothetical protein